MLLSPRLLDAITETLARHEQVLLFLNRRGFGRALQCIACGEPAGCPSCSVSLTWHERRAVLLCHHCGFVRPARATCASCGRDALRATLEGTERIESEIATRFPDARVGRLDRDTTGSKGAHRRILAAWAAGDLDVLIGTQMVTKGHDVPGVTLVGVLLADVALNMPDFRAGERAFQLLTQVAGRAGRGDRRGRARLRELRAERARAPEGGRVSAVRASRRVAPRGRRGGRDRARGDRPRACRTRPRRARRGTRTRAGAARAAAQSLSLADPLGVDERRRSARRHAPPRDVVARAARGAHCAPRR